MGWAQDFARRGRTICIAIPTVLLCVSFRPLLLLMVWLLTFEGLQEFHAMLRHIRLSVAGYSVNQCALPIRTSALHVQEIWRRWRHGSGAAQRPVVHDVPFPSTAEGKCIVGSLVAPLAMVSQTAFLAGSCLYFCHLVVLTMFDQNACRRRAEAALQRYQELRERIHRESGAARGAASGSASPPTRSQSVDLKQVTISPEDARFNELFLEAEMHLKAHFFEPQLLLTFLLEYVGFVWASGLCWGVMLRCHVPDGTLVVVAVLFSNWATDILALIVGRFVGRTPLYRAISPNKTKEGSAAGMVASAAVMVLCWGMFRRMGLREEWSPYGAAFDAAAFAAAGVALGLAGVVGDLIESFFKRAARLKDTGTFFPSHGGVLDRIDGLLFVFPLVYCAAACLL
eukprot:TRINITY_DN1203_c0_g1_i1.p1 TRINITY_DN1203_c0_g1~~TRINITY_DN1203_c0_g1_i1.p1  ORF type:complete len:427 (+),score=161.21 TRINITY_DN1203_c0_g1_i1:90-1283(+)